MLDQSRDELQREHEEHRANVARLTEAVSLFESPPWREVIWPEILREVEGLEGQLADPDIPAERCARICAQRIAWHKVMSLPRAIAERLKMAHERRDLAKSNLDSMPG